MREKKYLIILILKILENENDENHPLTQCKIAQAISEIFPCDRKTVGRNICFLMKVGYPIKKTSRGFYLDGKKFTVEEIDFILDAVRAATWKNETEKDAIIRRLCRACGERSFPQSFSANCAAPEPSERRAKTGL